MSKGSRKKTFFTKKIYRFLKLQKKSGKKFVATKLEGGGGKALVSDSGSDPKEKTGSDIILLILSFILLKKCIKKLDTITLVVSLYKYGK